MNNVLAICHFYPPFDSTAALEASKLTSYLPDSGWSPTILSATTDFAPTLPVELPDDRIVRTKTYDVNAMPKRILARNRGSYVGYGADDRSIAGRITAVGERAYRQLLNFPDGQVGWLPVALKEARRLIQRHRPDLIFSIAGPFTSHLVASKLARESGIPWFADFRDLWTDNHFFTRMQPLLAIERRLENRTMAAATAVSAPTPQWVGRLEERFGHPAFLVPNGFDPADIPRNVPQRARFTLTYTGVFYRRQQRADELLDALVRLRNEGAIDETSFELRLVGRYLDALRPAAASRGLSALVSFRGAVSHEEALRLQAESSALLFFLWTRPKGRGWLSAKVYEYMASGRPILALGPHDVDAAKLVLSMGAGEVAADGTAIVDTLRSWIKEFRATGSVSVHVDRDALKNYEWRNIGARLAAAFDETLA